MKKFSLLITSVLLFSISSIAQLRVDPSGRIGMGVTSPNGEFKCHVKGNMLLSTYPEIPQGAPDYVELRMKVGAFEGTPTIGTNIIDGGVAIWTEGQEFQDLAVKALYQMSDTAMKTDIQSLSIPAALEDIMDLQTYTYKFRNDSITDTIITYGFLTYQVKSVLPTLVDSAMGREVMSYQEIIPIMVAAMQQQQATIDTLRDSIIGGAQSRLMDPDLQDVESLREELALLREQMAVCCSQRGVEDIATEDSGNESSSILFQNRPNPFSEETIIEYDIAEDFKYASILIFDMQGTLKKTVPIENNGRGQITINGYELVAGMYLYSLIVDSKEIDTKRMILID